MSRLLSSFVFFIFIASNLCFGQLNVNFSTATPNPGETVEINVSVSNFVDIELFQFGIGWDSTVASFVSITNVTNDLAQFSEANNIGTPTNAALIDDGELSLSWSLNSTEPVTLTDGTVLFTIVVNIEGSACDETEFMVTSPPIGGNVEVFTNNLTVNIGATSSGGVVSIPGTDCGGGGGMDGVGLIGSMESGISGTQTCVRVSTENFTNIASLQTGITWNPSIISYASIQEGALNGISLNENETANGELKLLWLIGLGDDPVTLNDGANLFDICFDIVGSEGQMSDVSFVDLTNFNVEIADGDGISLDYFVENGKITVGTGGGGGGETCDIGVGLIGDSLSTAGVTNICVPFTSKDFTNIASVQTGIVWDENVLGLTEVVDGAMTDISVNDLNANMGELKLLWLIGLGDDAVTVSDGTVLFELCFDVLGADESSSSISFVDLPNFNIEIANDDGMSEEYCTITGFVEVTEDGGGGGGETCDVGVGIIGDSLTTNGVANICVPITARSFTNVASLQTGLLWDDSVLDLTEVNEGALTDISVNTLNASMGELKLLWIIGLSDDPVTVPDGTVLFELCFDVFGAEGSTSDISFVDLPGFDIEVANGEGMAAEFCTITGFVEVTEEGGGGGETCDIGVGLIGDSLSTNGLTNICIPVTSKDFTSIASVQTGVTWDESIMDLTGVNDGAMASISVNALNASMGELKLLWIIGLGDDPVTVPDGTVLFELCYDVLGAEGTSSSVSFVDLPDFEIEIANGEGISEEYCTITGFVEVTPDDGGGGETCDVGVGLIGDSLSTNGLTNVCVAVTSKDFANIASVQTGVTWDASILDLTEVTDGAMSGISVNALNASMGEIKLLWIISLGDDPVTVPDGTVLFELCFDVLGAEGTSSSVSFVDLPDFEIEIANGEGMAEEFCTITGFVDVTPDDGTGGETCDVGVGLIGDSLSTNGATNVCIPVTSKDFANIASVKTGVTWDASVMDLTEVNDGAMSGISVNALNASMGEIKLLWIIGLGDDPVTVPDGTVLFELCYDVLGAEGTSSSVSFVDLPDFEIEIANGEGMAEEYCTITGFVNVTPEGQENCEVGVGIIGDTLSVDISTDISFCMPITTKNFDNIASLQTGIQWDPSVLAYTSINEVGLTNASLNTTNAANGDIRFLWIIGLGDDPMTFADGATLFEICFDAIGEGEDMSDVSFVDLENFDVEIANGLGQAVDVCLIPGNVTLVDPVIPSDFSLIANDVSADQGTQTCVDVDVTGFRDIQSTQFTILWDETVLTYDRVEMLNPSICDLTANNFFPVGDDKLRVSWSCANSATIPDSSLFFKVCFNVIGECNPASSSSIEFVDDPPVVIEITNTDNEEIDPVILISGSVSVNECPEDFACMLTAVDSVKCKGDASGGIFVEFSGAVGNVTCSWTGPGGPYSDCDLQGIFAGTYVLTATDEAGSSCTMEVEVAEPAEAMSISAETISAICGTRGSIDVTVTGGTGDYSYAWDPEQGNIEDLTALVPGEYCVVVTDENGCTIDKCMTVEDSSIEINLTGASITNIDCDVPGAIDIDVQGGCTPLSYSWTLNGQSVGTTEDLSDLSETGTYTVIITDSSNPVQEISMEYTVESDIESLAISSASTTNIGCMSQGSIDIDIVGGCMPFTFNWTLNGQSVGTTEDLSGLTETGTYTVNITDSSNPVQETSMEYTVESDIESLAISSASTTNIGCMSQGSIDIDVVGGCTPLSYSWTLNGQSVGTTEDLSGLTETGTYTVNITDSSNPVQEISMEYTVGSEIETLTISSASTTNIGCMSQGSIDIDVVGGCTPLSYSWTLNGQSVGTTEDLSGLTETGTYTVNITDSSNPVQEISMEYTVGSEIETLTISSASTTNVECMSQGSIDIDVVGGCTPLSYSWTLNGQSVGTTEDLSGLTETGTYTVNVTDNSNPVQETSMEYTIGSDIETLTISQATTTNISCSSLGAVNISIAGGCTPISYNWTFNGSTIGTDQDISELKEAGTYTVIISDGSIPSQEVTMEFMLTSSVTELVVTGRASDLSCNGDLDGAVELIVTGGCPNYVFEWDNGETTEDIFNLAAGTYCVSVSDQFCPEEDPIVLCFDVEEPSPVLIDLIGIQHVTNLDGNNGVIDIEPSGGAGGYSFEWSPNGATTEDQINMPPGEYCVTVTDQNNCSAEACYTIVWAAVFLNNCVATPSDCSGECTGAINCEIVGGCSDVEIRINNVLVESFPIEDLCADTYTIEIVDECGNTDSEVIIIPEPGDMVLDTVQVICTGVDQRTGSIEIDIEGGTEPYVITWGGASECDGSTTCTGLGVGFYTVVVQDGGGCQALIQNIEITECTGPPKDCFEARPIITPNNDGLNDQFRITCADGFNNANLQVYDRWGRLVYEQDDYDSTWEGTHLNGTELDDGGYMWVLEIQLPNGDTLLRTGSLTILRTNF
jgi:gliding motility-associated-like protein